MPSERKVDRTMIGGGIVFALIGLKVLIEGIMHTISGTPIPATTWTPEATGPENVALGLVGLGLAGFAFRLALRGATEPNE